ncbi:MAG: hypothetical protein BRD48_05990 [Bacteroidetes bacterium QS_9_68_14]|nr:MAG: hypothetical protein BRD48_05990 [Bacteroidetes bacterium QS_9_68_14]
MRATSAGLVALLVATIIPLGGPQAAHAQTEWKQTFQVITPVQENSAASALRDSVVDVATREGISLRRSPDDESARPISQIEEELLEQGLDFTSANRLFIRYDFQAERGQLQRSIESLHFIYRPEGADGQDLSIMNVDVSEAPAIANLLENSGMTLRTNEASFSPFREQLMFHKLPSSQLVALGGDVIRDTEEAESERRRLLRAVQRFLY